MKEIEDTLDMLYDSMHFELGDDDMNPAVRCLPGRFVEVDLSAERAILLAWTLREASEPLRGYLVYSSAPGDPERLANWEPA